MNELSGVSGRETEHSLVQPVVLVMIVVVALLGSGLAWSILVHQAASEITLRGDALPAGAELKIDPAVALTLVARGADLVQSQCAGCHASVGRLAGPSWTAIADRTRRQIQQEPFCGAGLALVANAVTHPTPGWDGYAAGPQQTMITDDDRVALAAWILKPGHAASSAAPGGAS